MAGRPSCPHAAHLGTTCAHILPVAAFHSTTGHSCSVVRWLLEQSPHHVRFRLHLCSKRPTRSTLHTGCPGPPDEDVRGLLAARDSHTSLQQPLRLLLVSNRE